MRLDCLAVHKGPLSSNVQQIGEFTGLNSPVSHGGTCLLHRGTPFPADGWGHMRAQSLRTKASSRRLVPGRAASAGREDGKSSPAHRLRRNRLWRRTRASRRRLAPDGLEGI